jgi:hypothetical protein
MTRITPHDHYGWSGRRDSNPRPPVPKTGALTRLRHAPLTENSSNFKPFDQIREKTQAQDAVGRTIQTHYSQCTADWNPQGQGFSRRFGWIL